ncbi:unnamed protein product [Urochloa humidicola]
MTPQILLDNLRHSFFRLRDIALLIFDECHHAFLTAVAVAAAAAVAVFLAGCLRAFASCRSVVRTLLLDCRSQLVMELQLQDASTGAIRLT